MFVLAANLNVEPVIRPVLCENQSLFAACPLVSTSIWDASSLETCSSNALLMKQQGKKLAHTLMVLKIFSHSSISVK